MHTDAVGPTGPLRPSPQAGQTGGPTGASGRSFKEVCEDFLQNVNSLQKEAGDAARKVATGETDNLHELVIKLNEADLSFRLMMQVRNKLVKAYEEIMRMRV